jgi:hypothetical protein
MAGDYAVKVPTCDGLRIPAHRPRIRLNGSEVSPKLTEYGRTHVAFITSAFVMLRWTLV